MSGRPAKVCEVCLGMAETTQDKCKCNATFGSKGCNEWLWGWFVVDDTVNRSAHEISRNSQDNIERNDSKDIFGAKKEKRGIR